MSEWRQDTPEKSGYYLIAWYGGKVVGAGEGNKRYLVVTEVWFNPDARPSVWWLTRGYTGEPRSYTGNGHVPADQVVAWMPMPEPPDWA